MIDGLIEQTHDHDPAALTKALAVLTHQDPTELILSIEDGFELYERIEKAFIEQNVGELIQYGVTLGLIDG